MGNIFGEKMSYVSKTLKDFIFFDSTSTDLKTYSKIFMIFLSFIDIEHSKTREQWRIFSNKERTWVGDCGALVISELTFGNSHLGTHLDIKSYKVTYKTGKKKRLVLFHLLPFCLHIFMLRKMWFFKIQMNWNTKWNNQRVQLYVEWTSFVSYMMEMTVREYINRLPVVIYAWEDCEPFCFDVFLIFQNFCNDHILIIWNTIIRLLVWLWLHAESFQCSY